MVWRQFACHASVSGWGSAPDFRHSPILDYAVIGSLMAFRMMNAC